MWTMDLDVKIILLELSCLNFLGTVFLSCKTFLVSSSCFEKCCRETSLIYHNMISRMHGYYNFLFFFFQLSVGGFMYYWGLTIDTASCIGLQLATGLCVDYASHICHTFLSRSGTNTARALETMTDIGPAVFCGGFSTMLSLTMLSFSQSYIFKSFFKVIKPYCHNIELF